MKSLRLIWRRAYAFFYNLFIFEQWEIYIRRNMNCLENEKGFKKIKTPNGHFYADPFVIKKDGINYIFYEDYDYIKDKGSISCLVLAPNGKVIDNFVVLEKSYHLSFPYIFEYKNDFYMIPETLKAKRIDIYKAVNFPRAWQFEKTLINNSCCVDSNIFYFNNYFWLFTCEMSKESNKNVHLFFSENPLKEWHAHANNPIISDINNGRPAGKVFIYKDKLIRPSQNCNKRYGYAINFNIILNINERCYSEENFFSYYPNWKKNIYGNHTYNCNSEFEVIDALRLKLDLLKPIKKIKQKTIRTISR